LKILLLCLLGTFRLTVLYRVSVRLTATIFTHSIRPPY